MNQYFVGQETQLSVVFTDDAGNLVDPAVVVCTVIKPDGTKDTPEPVNHTASGTFSVDYTPTQNGLHVYRFEGDVGGKPISAGEKTFLTTTDFGTGG